MNKGRSISFSFKLLFSLYTNKEAVELNHNVTHHAAYNYYKADLVLNYFLGVSKSKVVMLHSKW